MSLIEDLKDWTATDYRKHGWRVMVTGKLADLGTTWYALVTFPMFVEGNPIPAVAYARYGPLGLVLLTALAIMLLTLGAEIMATQGFLDLWNKISTYLVSMFVPAVLQRAWIKLAAMIAGEIGEYTLKTHQTMMYIWYYWLPGLFWVLIAFSNLVTYNRAVDVLPGF